MHKTTIMRSLFPLLTFPLSFSLFAEPPHSAEVRPGTVLYKINSSIPANELKALNALLHSQGLVSQRTLQGSQVTIATFEHAGRETAVANILKRSGYVEFAEADYAVAPAMTPNDADFDLQWHHAAVNSPQAWDVTTGSNSVLVAVCDTGFEVSHPDLSANLRTDLAFNAQDGSDYIADANGHGTGTAGTLGAVGNNALGVAGVSWHVDIIPVRIAISDSNSSAYISTMATCIEYAADKGARIVNLSYGGIQYATIDSAARYLRSKNGLLFMSAGNDGQEFAAYPDYTSFVGVAATNTSNTRASFSNWGTFVDITAPGTSIRTTYPGNRYVYYSGTSFSSPLTAGVAALMVAANPGISADEIENGLFSTAADIGTAGDDNVYGHGLVDAQAAVNYAQNLDNLSAPVAVINASSSSVAFGSAVTLDGSGSSDSDGSIASYYWSLGDGTTSSLPSVNHTYSAAGSYQVNLTVTDNHGLSNSATSIIQVTNEMPTAAIDSMPTQYNIGDAVHFSALTSTDSDGTIVDYKWDLGNGETAHDAEFTYTYSTGGSYTVTLTVTDNASAQSSTDISIQVSDPYILSAPTNLQASVSGFNVALSWQDNSLSEDSVTIERGMKARGKTSYSDLITLGPDTTSFVDTVNEAGDYFYQIRVENLQSQATSSPLRVTVDSGATSQPNPDALPAPTGLTAVSSGDSVTLNWNYSTDGIAGFYVERGDKAKGKVTYSGDPIIVVPGINQYTETGLAAGTYSYRIKAFASDGNTSDYSNSAEARVR
ncbi:S8 family serine peptidase [Vibrio sp. H11]|uniref:S8 family serine peptidase n=1 Tax=Vibrio sp. H11 TaxID=2565928 RepID=UPI0010A645B4|nr:S8 family serine peptidase [Vibrio sp. H11]